MLIGCGKKTKSDGKSATGNDGEAVESTNGVSAETSASPENKLIGYWASDFKKTLENLKVLEANAPDDLLKEKYGRVIKSMEGELSRDLLPVALKANFIIHFEEGGETKIFVEGSEVDAVREQLQSTVVGAVVPGMPAELAGVLPGDQILEIDGVKVKSFVGMVDSVLERIIYSEGEEIVFLIKRQGINEPLEIRSGFNKEERPAHQRQDFRRVGITPISESIVDKTVSNSPAEKAGLKRGDKILEANGQKLFGREVLSFIIQKMGDDIKPIELLVQRNSENIKVSIVPEVPAQPEGSPAMLGLHWQLPPMTIQRSGRIGTYSIIDVKGASSSWRVDCDFGEEKFSMTLDGSTLRMNPPAVGGAEEAFPILFSRTDKFVPKIRPKLEGVNYEKLEEREGIYYLKDSDTPYTGYAYEGEGRHKDKEGNFKDGKMDGLYEEWYDNGKREVWYKDGHKEEEINYKNGKMDGLWVEWYENGQKAEEGNYKDGEKNGLWTEWYENGQKAEEGNYKDGEKNGLWTEWYENGQKKTEGNYKNGKPVFFKGSSRWWDKNGNLTDIVGNILELKTKPEGVNYDELVIEREDLGRIAYLKGSDTPYTGKFYSLYPSGQKEAEGNLKDGKPDGVSVGWNKNGQKKGEGNWKDGKPDGLFVRWHEDGQKKSEVNYKNGKKDGLYVEWHENGQKEEEGNYKDGKREGLYVGWYEDGQKR
ncbi:MAG: PDZ domain-containing protein [Verrucomicrobiales bacterium]